MRLIWILLVAALQAAEVGPERGSLVIVGGGELGLAIQRRFLDLAGGPDAALVVIPTAGDSEFYGDDCADAAFWRKAGFRNVAVLHTRDRERADSEVFAAPLKKARAVWYSGGRQWRLVDAYLGTRTQREIEGVLRRGGVIGGSSAGATIQGSYLVRGAREGNAIMMAPGYERGFGYLKNVAIDQHLIRRRREGDLLPVIALFPKLLGIGIDEGTAAVVAGDLMEVIGESRVAIYDAGYGKDPGYYFLDPGGRFDLRTRRAVAVRK